MSAMVVEGESRRVGQGFLHGHQEGIGGVVATHRILDVGHQRPVSDRHDPHPGIPVGCSVRAELLEATCSDAGLLGELAHRGVTQVFVGIDKASGERPPAPERIRPTLDQQDVQLALSLREDGNIGRDRERRIGTGVGFC
jgi:hypothetical protein